MSAMRCQRFVFASSAIRRRPVQTRPNLRPLGVHRTGDSFSGLPICGLIAHWTVMFAGDRPRFTGRSAEFAPPAEKETDDSNGHQDQWTVYSDHNATHAAILCFICTTIDGPRARFSIVGNRLLKATDSLYNMWSLFNLAVDMQNALQSIQHKALQRIPIPTTFNVINDHR